MLALYAAGSNGTENAKPRRFSVRYLPKRRPYLFDAKVGQMPDFDQPKVTTITTTELLYYARSG